MDYRISDLLDGIEDDSVRLSEAPAVSAERIEKQAMEKIRQTTKQTGKARKGRRAIFLIAAAAALMVTAAAAAIWHIQVQKVDKDSAPVYDPGDGSPIVYSDATHILRVQGAEGEARDICFQASYLPDGIEDMQCVAVSCRLKDYAEENGVEYNDLLADSELSAEEAEQWYVTMWNDGRGFLRIDVYDNAKLDGTDFIMEDAEEVRAGELNGMEARYFTQKNRVGHIYNHILLFSDALNCMTDICGDGDFEELEKVADGLVLRQTAIPAAAFTGDFTLLAGGVG